MVAESSDGPDSVDNQDRSELGARKRINTLDVIIVVSGLAITLAIMFYILSSERMFFQPHPFLYWMPQNHYNFTVEMNMYSTTFAAQSKVDVYVTARPIGPVYVLEGNRLQYEEEEIPRTFDRKLLADKIFIYFFDSSCSPIPRQESDRYSKAVNCFMTLDLQNDQSGYYYQNKASIWYPSEGTYNLMITTAALSDDFYVSFDDGLRIIRIGALPSTESYENTKIINTTTTLVAYVAIITAYFQGRSSIQSYVSHKTSS